jgi:DNA invertase Pin-like site-specific DNA recombinase
MSPQLRAVGYTRVSTDEQPTRIEDDTRRITAACQGWDYTLTEVIADVGVSGKVPLADRPNGVRIHDLIEAKGSRSADILVVTALDRLTRESEDGVALIKRMVPNGRRHPLLLVSLDDHIDLAGANGRFFAKLRVLLGEFERELVSERTSNALQHKRRTGRVYSSAPYGWDHEGEGEDRRLVPNESEQAVLVDMRAWRTEGVNDHAIAALLNSMGVPGKRGGRGRWQANLVYRILANADRIGVES